MSHQSTPKTWRSLIGHFRAAIPQLAPTEQRVVEALLSDPDKIALSSAVVIAQQADTSSATVVRTTQKLGYSGYSALRGEVIRLGMQQSESSTGVRSPAPVTDDVMDEVFSTAIDELHTASDTLDRQQFSDAVDILGAAQKILFIGSGESSMPAQEAALRFMM